MIGIDKKGYKIIGSTDQSLNCNIYIYTLFGKELQDIYLGGALDLEHKAVKLSQIKRINVEYDHFGFASLMFVLLLDIIDFYEYTNNMQINKIIGTLGFGGNDDPHKSIPFYKSFDNYIFNNKILKLNNYMLNEQYRNIEYKITKLL